MSANPRQMLWLAVAAFAACSAAISLTSHSRSSSFNHVAFSGLSVM